VRLFIIIFLFLTNLSFAVEVSCNFEEVYGNGDTQQGILLLKNQNLRYEYYDKELYTIIARDENFFLIHRAHKNNVQKITENTILLETFIDISSEYPNIKKNYIIEDIKIMIEKSADKFIKRISVNSDAVNVSINLMNCNFSNIDRKYFKVFNFKEIDN
tara:strand:+ start:485 stop:961 length:477 start_codon:yes stop_codon:yes gene_type:complete